MSDQASFAPSVPEWTLGWRLQRSLAHAGMKSEEMAQELGVGRASVSRWMNDRGAPPRAAFVKQWALRTGVPYEWIMTGKLTTKTPPDRGNRPSRWNAPISLNAARHKGRPLRPTQRAA